MSGNEQIWGHSSHNLAWSVPGFSLSSKEKLYPKNFVQKLISLSTFCFGRNFCVMSMPPRHELCHHNVMPPSGTSGLRQRYVSVPCNSASDLVRNFRDAPYISCVNYDELKKLGFQISYHALLSDWWTHQNEEDLPEEYCLKSLDHQCFGVLPWCEGGCMYGCSTCTGDSVDAYGEICFVIDKNYEKIAKRVCDVLQEEGVLGQTYEYNCCSTYPPPFRDFLSKFFNKYLADRYVVDLCLRHEGSGYYRMKGLLKFIDPNAEKKYPTYDEGFINFYAEDHRYTRFARSDANAGRAFERLKNDTFFDADIADCMKGLSLT